jgi:hypothetical protein
MLADMDSDEITDWMAYEQVTGPLGSARHDLLHGIRSSVMANTVAPRGRKTRPQDFIPEWDQNKEPDWEQMLATVRVMNSRFGGQDLTLGEGEDDGHAG